MYRPFARTKSVCPVCLRVLDAEKAVGGDGHIHLVKVCPDHGKFDALIWEGDIIDYLKWGSAAPPSAGNRPGVTVPADAECPRACGLCAEHESAGCCVLLELTDRCNLCCPVCFASAGESGRGSDLSLGDVARLYDLLLERGGPFNIQLSGGEPTVRDDLPEIVALGRERGFSYFQLNTNGLRLAQEPGYASLLREAGVSCAFLQFDALDNSAYTALRGRPLLGVKLRAVDNCAEAGLPVVLVPTLAPGVNDHMLGDILRFALGRMSAVRGVHIQPISYFGRCGLPQPGRRLTIPRVLREIERQTEGAMRASDFAGGGAESAYCSFHAAYRRLPDGSLRALPRRRSQCCCVKSADAQAFVADRWGAHDPSGGQADAFDEFLAQARENSFTVSGMVFQDAMTLDLERLRRCYICEADPERGLVPFCAYNLTDSAGRALYRR